MPQPTADRWQALRDALEASYEVTDHKFDLLTVTLAGGERPIKVGVRRRRDAAVSSDLVEVTAHVRDSHRVNYGTALRATSDLSAASLCILGPELFVRRLLDLEDLDVDKLAEVMNTLAELGRTLGTELTAPSMRGELDSDPFAYVID